MSTPLRTPEAGCIAISSLAQAKKHKRRYHAVITLEDPGCRLADRLRFSTQPKPAHLVLQFEDVDDDSLGIRVATQRQVSEALSFAQAQNEGSLLVHCYHGVGRSAGIGLAILASRLGSGNEERALAELLEIRPEATPNLVVVKLADAILGRSGALVSAVAEWQKRTPGVLKARQDRAAFVRRAPHLYAPALSTENDR
jgi:predicted protein tyrosine phosphatase